MKLAYVAHPYTGYEETAPKQVEKIIRELRKKNHEVTYISPVNSFAHFGDTVSYDDMMMMCFNLLQKCDVLILAGNWRNSVGCKLERMLAENLAIEIVEVEKWQ